MECTVPVEAHLATEHADVGSLKCRQRRDR